MFYSIYIYVLVLSVGPGLLLGAPTTSTDHHMIRATSLLDKLHTVQEISATSVLCWTTGQVLILFQEANS